VLLTLVQRVSLLLWWFCQELFGAPFLSTHCEDAQCQQHLETLVYSGLSFLPSNQRVRAQKTDEIVLLVIGPAAAEEIEGKVYCSNKNIIKGIKQGTQEYMKHACFFCLVRKRHAVSGKGDIAIKRRRKA